MAKKEELYVSFEEPEYKKGKSNVLKCQADLLNLMKYLENLKYLYAEKKRLKIKLKQLFSEFLRESEVLEKEMPNPKLPKALKKNEEEIETERPFSSKYEEIDSELKEIQDKLKGLNT